MSKRRGFKFASDDGEETANDILDDQQQDEVIDTFKERSERMKAETLIMVRAVAMALGIGVGLIGFVSRRFVLVQTVLQILSIGSIGLSLLVFQSETMESGADATEEKKLYVGTSRSAIGLTTGRRVAAASGAACAMAGIAVYGWGDAGRYMFAGPVVFFFVVEHLGRSLAEVEAGVQGLAQLKYKHRGA